MTFFVNFYVLNFRAIKSFSYIVFILYIILTGQLFFYFYLFFALHYVTFVHDALNILRQGKRTKAMLNEKLLFLKMLKWNQKFKKLLR